MGEGEGSGLSPIDDDPTTSLHGSVDQKLDLKGMVLKEEVVYSSKVAKNKRLSFFLIAVWCPLAQRENVRAGCASASGSDLAV